MNDVIVYFSLMGLIYSVTPTGERSASLNHLKCLFVRFLKGIFCWFTLQEINMNEEILTESWRTLASSKAEQF